MQDKEPTFLQLLVQEISSVFKSFFGKSTNNTIEPELPEEIEQENIEQEPISEQAQPQSQQQPEDNHPKQTANIPSRQDKLQAVFSEKINARAERRKNAVKHGDALRQKYAADGSVQMDMLDKLMDEEEDEEPMALPKPRNGSSSFTMPSITIFSAEDERHEINQEEIQTKKTQIQNCLDSFLVDADVGDAVHGPRVTMFKVHVADGVMVSNVTKYEDELRMHLSAETLRILAPVPGYDYIGIEVPNEQADTVRCGSIMNSDAWNNSRAALPLILGRDIAGNDCIMDLAKAPHLLVAGATGSGKSVCLNLFISSLVTRFAPDELRLLLVDPKVVEMQMYSRLPHLMIPVINDPQLVLLALHWLIDEMERRYRILALAGGGIVNIAKFNSREIPPEPIYDEAGEPIPEKLPYIVIIIDELADIMLNSDKQDVENSLARLAQKSRAIGIHVIVATQRPSVDVITGNIKANFPTRIAFKTASQVDSRTILDGKGAECLLGRGDMLFKSNGGFEQQRIQCAMVTDEEIEHLVDFWAEQGDCPTNFDIIKTAEPQENEMPDEELDDESTDLLRQAVEIIINDRRPTISYLQRRLGIGYNKAATLIESMEKYGILSAPDSQKHRQIMFDTLEDALAQIN